MNDFPDATGRDKPRPDATGRDADYVLSLDDVAAMYEAAGHPRTLRTLQRYCASGHLEAQKLATTTGDKYLVTPQSVERHIAQIKELAGQGVVATGRDKPRPVATAVDQEIKPSNDPIEQATGGDKQRQGPTTEPSQHVAHLEREVERLQDDREFLREQMKVKDIVYLTNTASDSILRVKELAMSVLNAPHFYDEHAAIARLERILWPNGPVCPRCGKTDKVYEIKGKTARPGLRTCGKCRKQFTVKIGTLFEDSHVPMHKWWQAIHLLVSSKKGISSHQLHRTLKVTYKTAWFMSHRIREAMRSGNLAPMGIKGKIVEVDETFIGQKKGQPKRRGTGHKHAVLSLVERGGEVRSVHVDDIKTKTVVPIVNDNIAREARVMTDDALQYHKKLGHFAEHGVINHSADEYVRGDVHTNTVESYFALFKRGMKGVYQHCSEKHLHRYLAEFDFRYNNRSALGVEDEARAVKAAGGIKGKRLKYRDSSRPAGRT